MKRKLALWGVVLSLVLGWESLSFGQQQTPVSAANDSLSTTGQEVEPTTGGEGPSEMQADTASVVHIRRNYQGTRYYMSLGIGSAINYLPDEFSENFDPAFGLRVGGGVNWGTLRVGIIMSYNFFLSNGPTTIYPDDLNIMTIFGEVKFVPGGKSIRPYILACAGYFRQWIVNADYVENVPGYGAGAGVELVIDKMRRLYIEGRYIQGQTRETENEANTELIPFAFGVVWIF